LAVCIWDNPEEVMVARVLYGTCPTSELSQGAPMGYLTFQPLKTSFNQHVYWEHLEETDIHALHTVAVRPICNHFL